MPGPISPKFPNLSLLLILLTQTQSRVHPRGGGVMVTVSHLVKKKKMMRVG